MPSWILILFIALLIVSVILLKMPRGSGMGGGLFGGGSAGTGYVNGTLTVTSVASGAMDRNGQRICTVSGTILGPDTPGVEVYGRLVLPSGELEPRPGEDRPVVYKPGKEESTWRFGTVSDPLD